MEREKKGTRTVVGVEVEFFFWMGGGNLVGQ